MSWKIALYKLLLLFLLLSDFDWWPSKPSETSIQEACLGLVEVPP